MQLSFEELKHQKINFGKTHVGRTYLDMLTEPKYLTWFSRYYKDSQNVKHFKFLRFLQLHVEHQEVAESSTSAKECSQVQGQSQSLCSRESAVHGGASSPGWTPDAPGRRRVSKLGSDSPGRGQPRGDAGAQGSHEQPRDDAFSSCRASESILERSPVSGLDSTVTPIEPCRADAHQQDILLAGWSSMFEHDQFWDPDDITDEGEFVGYNRENNWVATEMWSYMKSLGVHEHSQKGRSIRSDLMEIYCSQESQLTHCMKLANGDAERFGLKQGDLSSREGRCRLYDRLLVKQPRHLWMSPRCRAWCRWSQFNMSKKS